MRGKLAACGRQLATEAASLEPLRPGHRPWRVENRPAEFRWLGGATSPHAGDELAGFQPGSFDSLEKDQWSRWRTLPVHQH
jgi:hypothetical protein